LLYQWKVEHQVSRPTVLSFSNFSCNHKRDPLTKSSQQRKIARHCKIPMKSSIIILGLPSKQYYRVVTVLIRI